MNETMSSPQNKKHSDFIQAFIRKTVVRVDTSYVNTLKFYFSDGTTAELEAISNWNGIPHIELMNE